MISSSMILLTEATINICSAKFVNKLQETVLKEVVFFKKKTEINLF